MNDNRKRILEMLAENKITVDEAERLLAATGEKETDDTAARTGDTGTDTMPNILKKMPKYLRVQVEPGPNANPGNADKVNVRVPMSLIRAGMKLTSLIPAQAHDKINEEMQKSGINFDLKNIKPEDMDDLIMALSDLEVDVDGETKVRVFAE
jgi:hypothetical protein